MSEVSMPELSAQLWPEWMNTDSAARYIDSSPDLVRRLIKCGELPAAKVGRHRIHRGELDKLMKRYVGRKLTIRRVAE